MEDIIERIDQDLHGRLHAPLTLRLLLQPAVATFFAVRSGRRDVGKVFVIAIALDIIYQLIVLRWIYPTGAAHRTKGTEP